DASRDERIHGYLSEMLVYAGSVFTMTPSAFERTGVGFRIAERVTAARYVQNSRVARLLPGSTDAAGCRWYYSRPFADMAFAPLIVRSRFDNLVQQGAFVQRYGAGQRILYEITKPTGDVDRNLEFYWRPRLIS